MLAHAEKEEVSDTTMPENGIMLVKKYNDL